MNFPFLSIQVRSVTSFVCESTPGHFLEDMRPIQRGTWNIEVWGEEEMVSHERCAFLFFPRAQLGPAVCRVHTPPHLPWGHVWAGDGGRKMCNLIRAPPPWQTQLTPSRKEVRPAQETSLGQSVLPSWETNLASWHLAEQQEPHEPGKVDKS